MLAYEQVMVRCIKPDLPFRPGSHIIRLRLAQLALPQLTALRQAVPFTWPIGKAGHKQDWHGRNR